MANQPKYPVSLEIAGPMAMFARPDTGGTPTSYPVPTFSACKGIFESIAWFKEGDAWIKPTAIEVCRRKGEPGGKVNYQAYTTNYGGPLRKGSQISKDNNYQFIATVLADVCYRIHGVVVGTLRHPKRGNNVCHHLQALFQRRLRQGRCWRTPVLGWSEFTASYWGDLRLDVTEVDEDLNLEIPSMLYRMWDNQIHGDYSPVFQQNVALTKGILSFAE